MIRITRSTLYLLPAFGFDQKELLNLGFINCFIADSEETIPQDKQPVYFLFKVPKDKDLLFGEFELRNQEHILDSYDSVNGYLVLILKFPERFASDYKHFLDSKITRFSNSYKKLFKRELGPVERKYTVSSSTKSVAWAVINRDPDIIKFREEMFDVVFEPDMELIPLLDIPKETIWISDHKIEVV